VKVSPDHLTALSSAIVPLDTRELRDRYRARDIPRGELVKDIDRRYRWDLFWMAVRAGNSLPDSTNGYNDAHIDTALRHIVSAL